MKICNNTEMKIFVPSIILSGIIIVLMLLFPDFSKIIIDEVFAYFTHDLGWLYLITTVALCFFSAWIVASRYGSIKLGDEKDEKAYSDLSWTAMMFAAGMSISVVLLGFTESIKLFNLGTLGAEPGSIAALENAHIFTQFFYGPIAWAIYGPASVAVAYNMYIHKSRVLRISDACKPILGARSEGWVGITIDVIVIMGMVGGISTSLGLGTPAVTYMIEYLMGIPESMTVTICVLMIWGGIFFTSVYMGLDKGIKRLSDINLLILLGLMVVVIMATDFNQWMYLQINSIGKIIDNFGILTLGSDPFGQDTFTQDWTIFYWAWWFGFMPMMALFGAKISKGRTIRQLILGEVIYGGGGAMIVFGLFGNYALRLQESGVLDLVTIMKTEGVEATLVSILSTLPFANLVIWMVLVLIFVFLATTLDSTAYTLASVCSKSLKEDEQPERSSRMVWALILLLFALGLVLIGGLQTVQTASILLGFPLIFISFVTMAAVKRMFKNHAIGKNEDE